MKYALLLFIASLCGYSARAEPAQKPKVVCFGDSITKRGYSETLAKLIEVEAINAGVGGNSSAKGLRRITADVLDHKPDVVVILFGTNDLRADAPKVFVTLEQYKTNLKKMIKLCRQQGAKVVLCTLPPIDHTAFYTRHEREPFNALGGLALLIESYAEAARQVSASENTVLVDLNALLAKQPEWMSKDGVHPSEAGNAIIAKHIAKAITAK